MFPLVSYLPVFLLFPVSFRTVEEQTNFYAQEHNLLFVFWLFCIGCNHWCRVDLTMGSPVELSSAAVSELLACQKVLGEGVHSEVGLVPWDDGKVAVIKLLKEECPQDVFQREKFVLEMLKGVGGTPHLLGFCGNPLALITSYMGPLTFPQILKQYKLPDWYLGIILLEIGKRILEIHAAGVVHNDMHGRNVIVNLPPSLAYLPEVKIIDFGQAKIYKRRMNPLKYNEYQDMVEGFGEWVGTPEKDVFGLGDILGKLLGQMSEIPISAGIMLGMTRGYVRGQQSSMEEVLKEIRRMVYQEMNMAIPPSTDLLTSLTSVTPLYSDHSSHNSCAVFVGLPSCSDQSCSNTHTPPTAKSASLPKTFKPQSPVSHRPSFLLCSIPPYILSPSKTSPTLK